MFFNQEAKKQATKANIIANAIDAEAKAGINTLNNGLTNMNQFDIIEGQLATFVQMAEASGDTGTAQQFRSMQVLMDSIQNNVKKVIGDGMKSFQTIQAQTDPLQKELNS